MPQKARLTLEERLSAVQDCISGTDSTLACSKRIGVARETLRCWIRLYEARGVEGLIPSTISREYSPELKVKAVEDYLLGKGSLIEISAKYNISRHSMLQKWIRCYNSHKDFKQPRRGGATYMTKGRGTTQEERIEIVSHCIANGRDYGKTIGQYGVSYPQIYGWVRKYEVGGVDALIDRRGKRKDKDAMTEVEKLQAQLKLKDAENLRLQMENDLLKKLEALERGIDAD